MRSSWQEICEMLSGWSCTFPLPVCCFDWRSHPTLFPYLPPLPNPLSVTTCLRMVVHPLCLLLSPNCCVNGMGKVKLYYRRWLLLQLYHQKNISLRCLELFPVKHPFFWCIFFGLQWVLRMPAARCFCSPQRWLMSQLLLSAARCLLCD